MKLPLLSLSAVVLGLISAQAHAASVYLSPTPRFETFPTNVSFELMMDFTVAEATLGGGIDIDLRGPISVVGFVPSTFFLTVADPAFSGHGAVWAQDDYEVHFANFNGMSGKNSLGTFTVNLQGPGEAELRLAINTHWGSFFFASGLPQNVTLIGANINPVPEPASAALWLAGVAMLGVAVKRRARAIPRSA
jgi:PEP-CTERM motif